MGTRFVLAAWCGIPALLLATGWHRVVYEFLDGLPPLVVAATAGLANLAWFEVAYVIATAAKQPLVYVGLPWIGFATALLAVLVVSRPGPVRPLALAHVATGLVLGGLALALLTWRAVRGFDDPWRLATAATFVLAHGGWTILLAWRRAPAPAPDVALDR